MSISVSVLTTLLLFSYIRCHSCSDFIPIRRYHPSSTKFKINSQTDDLVTAEDIEYAYPGGDGPLVDFTGGHKVKVQGQGGGVTSPGHSLAATGPTAADSHSLIISSDHNLPTGPSDHHLVDYHTGFFIRSSEHSSPAIFRALRAWPSRSSQTGPRLALRALKMTGEVDLTSSGSDIIYTDHEDHDGYKTSIHDHVYDYEPPSGHDHSYGLLHAEPPPHLGYPSYPKPAEMTTLRPKQEAKQSPNFTYYYLGRHLWYIPLYFSIYFILYVGALVLKSVARHKILFPQNLQMAAAGAGARQALDHLEQGQRKYLM